MSRELDAVRSPRGRKSERDKHRVRNRFIEIEEERGILNIKRMALKKSMKEPPRARKIDRTS